MTLNYLLLGYDQKIMINIKNVIVLMANAMLYLDFVALESTLRVDETTKFSDGVVVVCFVVFFSPPSAGNTLFV